MYKEMTVAHQLKYFARLKGLSKSEAEASLTKWSEKFGVTDWLEKKVEELSKGMQQKIQFIGTVMHNPKLLILDEPFSGLDPVNTNLLKREIYRLKDDGLGIIFSTHRMEQAEEICEDIALINRGRIALEGNLQEVKERYKDYTYQIRTEPKQLESPEKLVENPSTQLQADKEGYILAVDSDAQANEVLSKLLRQGYEVREFREKLPSLNQIFIQVVENGETQDSEEVNRRDDEDQEGSKSSESSQESEGESIDKDIETRQEDSSEPDSEEKPKASTKVEVTPENKS
jgi:ABC-2 type transport system ATP-binding protein